MIWPESVAPRRLEGGRSHLLASPFVWSILLPSFLPDSGPYGSRRWTRGWAVTWSPVMGERVAITGIGVVTPIGIGLDAFGRALRAGTSGVRRIDAFDCTGFDTQIAAAVPHDFDGTAWVQPRKLAKLMSRSALFAVAAAAMARQAAGLAAEDADPERIGVVLGAAGMGPTDNDLLATQAEALIASAGPSRAEWDVPSFARAFCQRTNPLATLRGLPNLAAAHVAIQQDARGPNSTITTACTAGTQAIGEGLRL